ncbi:MAG: acetyl-CoA hydrolase/transferase family protein [Deltaproteobacteria bacterium]|nr:acetyl-CoA hydrolase/transferase family protein [Deltaproteobacteria bacterium]MBW1925526.1 acetyl-CoA hydrolase/transferase family protein [Deltaproteobacteria bacterium]MBW2009180.1 acetyl-CoA hydrolase/transferase family protein [Deltaproteobacteria bacterium]MBW2348426.1 acetyl-CoA hydrolase/transferase family protein [Deltaproteobacteria bacterium]RLB38719.1 MAG: 4-hydroxybutyrate CoA-transferase [Deltaproteobacteria bacterium]
MKGSKKHRNVSPEEAIGHISPGRRLVLPLCCGLPQTLIDALIAQKDRLQGTEIVSGLQVAYPFLAEGLEASFTFRTWQCAPPIRHLLKKGTVRYIPMRQGDAVRVFSKKGPWPVDVALIQVSPPDEHGFCSLGVSIGHMLPLSLEAELVIAEVNPRMPRVLGDSFIHLSRIDYVVESDRELLEYPSGGKPGEKEISIGRHAAELIPDGATLQIGIGAIPEAILDGLSEKRDLRFFAMGVDKIVDMVEKGVVVPGPGPKIRVTEILGSRRLFDFVHENPMVEGRPLPETINPQVVGRIPRFCSVVSAIELDLTGQVNAETVKGMQISAIGGSFDFIQGALFSEGGCSILALTSTTPDEKISRIVPQLAPGTAVTTPRHSVQYVVTEYGIAEIWGRSLKERALALAQIAHPKFRDDLLEKAKELF